MGSVKRDIYKTDRQHEIVYAYFEGGIERLLTDIYRIRQEELRGDLNATAIRLDLESALTSKCLTPKQREALGLYYFCCLKLREISEILDINIDSVHSRIKNGILALSEYMRGEPVTASQLSEASFDVSGPLERWILAANMNEPNWYRVPHDVWAAINARWPVPNRGYIPPKPDVGWKTEEQLRRKWRREFPRPEIYPRFEYVGKRKGTEGSSQRLMAYTFG